MNKTKKHNEFCEGHVTCPKTGKLECGKVVVTKVTPVGCEAAMVYCFGYGGTHNVQQEEESV